MHISSERAMSFTRVLSVFACLCMLCLMFSGCAQRDASENKNELYPYEERQDPFTEHEAKSSGDNI